MTGLKSQTCALIWGHNKAHVMVGRHFGRLLGRCELFDKSQLLSVNSFESKGWKIPTKLPHNATPEPTSVQGLELVEKEGGTKVERVDLCRGRLKGTSFFSSLHRGLSGNSWVRPLSSHKCSIVIGLHHKYMTIGNLLITWYPLKNSRGSHAWQRLGNMSKL